VTVEDDLRELERRRAEVEVLKATNPRVEKIRAKAQIKAAQAESEDYQIARMFKWGALGVATILLGISACSASVWGFGHGEQSNINKDQSHLEMYKTCIEAGGSWDNSQEDCDK